MTGPGAAHLRRAGLPGAAAARRAAGYVLLPQTDHFGDALAAADLAVSRAGGTVWELAAAGTPSILVPYPHATADHQTLNARHFERGGGAIVVAGRRGRPRARPRRASCSRDPARLEGMREAMLALARPEAAETIAEELVALAPRDAVVNQLGRSTATPLLRRDRRLGDLRVREHRASVGGGGARLGRPRHDLHGDARRDRRRPRRRAATARRVGGRRLDGPSPSHRGDAAGGIPRRARRARGRRSWSPARTARRRRPR